MVAAKLVSSSTRSLGSFRRPSSGAMSNQSRSLPVGDHNKDHKNQRKERNTTGQFVRPYTRVVQRRNRLAFLAPFPSQKDGLEKLRSRESGQRGCGAAALGHSPSIRRTGRHSRQFARFLPQNRWVRDLASGLSSGWNKIH